MSKTAPIVPELAVLASALPANTSASPSAQAGSQLAVGGEVRG